MGATAVSVRTRTEDHAVGRSRKRAGGCHSACVVCGTPGTQLGRGAVAGGAQRRGSSRTTHSWPWWCRWRGTGEAEERRMHYVSAKDSQLKRARRFLLNFLAVAEQCTPSANTSLCV